MSSIFNSIVDIEFIGERMSFLQLIDRYGIVIPIIQRDYAQGRLDERVTEVRQNFVRSLISYLRDPENNSHDLDFIYGTVNKASCDLDEFIPLDGQQRLTTLFLLHWYISGVSGHYSEFAQLMKTSNNVCKFSYKTRNSSSMFCEKILSKYQLKKDNGDVVETDIFEQLKNDLSKKTSIADVIKNQGWFSLSWLDDPTIAGMLVMLSEIELQFFNIKEEFTYDEAYNRLFTQKDVTQPITFQLLPLNDYSRTEDLYIKLNARGIHLSDFENFKARIEDLIEMDEMTCKKEFIDKVDISWSEYLWKDRGDSDNTDAVMENLFRNFIAFSYRTEDKKDIIKERMDHLLEQNRKKMRFTYYQYCDLKVMHRRDESVPKVRIEAERNMINKIIGFFDVFCNEETSPLKLESKWFIAKNFISNNRINANASYHDRLRLYAYMQYCFVHKENIENTDLQDWLRFIRNLDEATDINDTFDFYQSLRSIDSILETIAQKRVQEWLSSDLAQEYNISFFRSRMFIEECIKSKLVKKEDECGLNYIKDAIKIGDENDYFNGQMGFALEFAGAYDMYKANQIEHANRMEMEDLGIRIYDYIKKSTAIITELKKEDNDLKSEHLLERALLSLGMYMRPNTSNRFNFCNILGDQYNSWKTMLFVEKETILCRDIFKNLLDIVSINSLKEDLYRIISDHKNDPKIPLWRKLIINNKDHIKYCQQGFIYINDISMIDSIKSEVDVLLFKQSQKNHYHSELYSRDLYLSYKQKQNNLLYYEQKSYEEDNYVVIPFYKENEHFEFLLSHRNGKWKSRVKDINSNSYVSDKFNFEFETNQDGNSFLNKVFEYLKFEGYTF